MDRAFAGITVRERAIGQAGTRQVQTWSSGRDSLGAVLAVFEHWRWLDGRGEVVLQALCDPAQAEPVHRQPREDEQGDDQPALVAPPRFAVGDMQGIHGRVLMTFVIGTNVAGCRSRPCARTTQASGTILA